MCDACVTCACCIMMRCVFVNVVTRVCACDVCMCVHVFICACAYVTRDAYIICDVCIHAYKRMHVHPLPRVRVTARSVRVLTLCTPVGKPSYALFRRPSQPLLRSVYHQTHIVLTVEPHDGPDLRTASCRTSSRSSWCGQVRRAVRNRSG